MDFPARVFRFAQSYLPSPTFSKIKSLFKVTVQSTEKPLRDVLCALYVNECKQLTSFPSFPSHAKTCFICYFWHSYVHVFNMKNISATTQIPEYQMSALHDNRKFYRNSELGQKGKGNHKCRRLIAFGLIVCLIMKLKV